MEYTLTAFEPVSGLAGGAMIGAAAALMLLFAGRITGISGIAAGLITTQWRDNAWRGFFIAGMIGGAALYPLLSGEPLPVQLQAGTVTMLVGGFLVGFGTRLGSGCTAGHGICGIARLSRRSIIATVVFFTCAAMTVNLVRHGLPAGAL